MKYGGIPWDIHRDTPGNNGYTLWIPLVI